MDMNRHLRRWLNDRTLRELGDAYDGVIASVSEEMIRNRFTAEKKLEPVITFEDGWRLLPNISQRRALIQFFGADTGEWVGQRVVVYRHRVTQTDQETGAVRDSWEKRVRLPAQVALHKIR